MGNREAANGSESSLAVSNIAWPAEEEGAVAEMLQSLGVRNVEIAPTKVFADPTATSRTDRADYRRFWADHDISIVAFQSMLFGRADLQIFGDTGVRAETVTLLSRFIELAGNIDVGILVFGSPRNRVVPPEMDPAEARDIACDIFGKLGQVAADNNTQFCIEPNPSIYGCNFITTAAGGLDLVTAVDHRGFGLHLDAAGMTLEGDSLTESIHNAAAHLAHFHASAPNLGALEETLVDHQTAANALRDIKYSGFVSIEMRPGQPGTAPANVTHAVQIARRHYTTKEYAA
ncbi:sugar phosphate isomerase/epimerase [Cryobacterium sp. Hh7]|uniref:sugar phosphate isomerase/epimerase family protein n=1 Tax=Cryobacterium sp. Hh7 TaxID=1259159 RepID=UPI00106D6BE9|nr:TIM barrel protein [Cryobacterium sp. Hh7]TFD51769.1 sugar phosphate isomerase/epimerase [Cryobacterium sp. Hh7]